MRQRTRTGCWRLAPLLALWALLCGSGFVAPSPDWDAIPYAALAARQAGEADPKARAYADLAAIVPLGPYVTGRYRQSAYVDDAFFADNLRFYAERAGYTLLNTAAGQLAGNFVRGLQVTSFLAGLVAMAGLFLLLRDAAGMGFGMAAALGIGVGLASGIVNFSRFLSPDILAAALQLLVVLAYVRRRIAAQTLWSLALVTARPDFVLFPLALAFVDLACRLRRREGVGIPWQAAPALAALAGWGVLRASMDHPGWAAIVNFTILLGQDALELHARSIDWHGYLASLASHGILALYKDPRFVMALGFLCSAAWWWLVAAGRSRSPGRLPVAAAASAAFVLGHVLLFPVVWDRFFAASYAIIMISLLAAQRSATRPSDERAPARSVRIILPVRDLRGGGLPAKPAVAPADR